ncbi:MAG: hypothetical protein K5678_05175 [Acetatifactor sp.]|nr:hypothetical protein [Acetatifactor sp.]
MEMPINRFLKYEPDCNHSLMGVLQPDTRFGLCCLELTPDALTGRPWLHAVEATMDCVKGVSLIRVRVIVKGRGVNVTIRAVDPAMRYRYLRLRTAIRNCDYVEIEFDHLSVVTSPARSRELYLLADDFRMMED